MRIASITPRRVPEWLAPTGLILLSLIPVLAGAARLTELTGGPTITPQNARFIVSPVPVVIHIVSATTFSLVGAFQFVPSLRSRAPRWHRFAGRILAPAGILVALSGLWMAVFYSLPPGDGPLLLVFRVIFGTAMLTTIVLALLAIRQRAFDRHGAWMTRAYALGVAAGTQPIVLGIWISAVGPTDEFSRTMLMGAAWMINLGVAEIVIRRRAQLTLMRRATAITDRRRLSRA